MAIVSVERPGLPLLPKRIENSALGNRQMQFGERTARILPHCSPRDPISTKSLQVKTIKRPRLADNIKIKKSVENGAKHSIPADRKPLNLLTKHTGVIPHARAECG